MEIILVLFIPLGVFLLFGISAGLIYKLSRVAEEHRFLKLQIAKSGSLREQQHWKRQLKKFYLRQIPIVGLFIR